MRQEGTCLGLPQAQADTELYERIRKESRKRKGASASCTLAAKCSKSVPTDYEKKDLKHQLENARLERIREALEKRKASLSSSQSSSKCGESHGRGRGRGKGGNQRGKGRLPWIPPPKKEKDLSDSRKKEKMNKDESANSREENLNIVCMKKEPPGNKAVMGRVAPNLNFSVLSLSSANHPRLVLPQSGLSSAAPRISETQKSVPTISEKSQIGLTL